MADYTANSYATTILNLSVALGCANTAAAVEAALRANARLHSLAAPAPSAELDVALQQMIYVADQIRRRENASSPLEVQIANRAGDLIATFPTFLAAP